MSNRLRWLLWVISLILIGNFIMLRIYGDTLRSTHLFIVRGTVFYPFSWLNLIAGIILALLLIREWVTGRRKLH
ncbi:MAG: hypothetical protein HYU83_01520 [Chloroflexi bacterium]|nr:hypothetical protein [Chloroflexota bacterium]